MVSLPVAYPGNHSDAFAPAASPPDTALREPFTIDGHELYATASIGIAVSPADGTDGETLLENADTAMYWAKSCGRDNFQFFSTAQSAYAFTSLWQAYACGEELNE